MAYLRRHTQGVLTIKCSFYLFFCMRINLTGVFGSWTGRFRVKYGEEVMAVAVQASEQGFRIQFM